MTSVHLRDGETVMLRANFGTFMHELHAASARGNAFMEFKPMSYPRVAFRVADIVFVEDSTACAT